MKDKNWFQDTDIFRCTAQQSEGKQANRHQSKQTNTQTNQKK